MKFAVSISYVGTGYCGWQRQSGSAASGKPSIQETLEKSLDQMTQEGASVVGSGRTDAGVHANSQIAHFRLEKKKWDPNTLRKGLNSLLPQDIRVREIAPVEDEFHAQRSATRKTYSYFIYRDEAIPPHIRPFAWHNPYAFDLDRLSLVVEKWVGEHDFKAFQASGAPEDQSTVRTIFHAEVHMLPSDAFMGLPAAGELFRIDVCGSGFLKQMVRSLVGTSMEIAKGRKDLDLMDQLLGTGNRDLIGLTAPAHGLWLESVEYGHPIVDKLGKDA